MIDYTKSGKSLENLQSQFFHYSEMDESLPQWIQEAVCESVIRRFEVCFDSLLKVLKQYLHDELGIAELPNAPKPVLRIAHENSLLPSGIDQWFDYVAARQSALHDYNAEKKLTVSAVINDFLNDAAKLIDKFK